jgi:mono/diheme cytochrome c family protein
VPRWILIALASLTAASLLPLACIARARVTRSPEPRVHLVRHMDQQESYKGDEPNPVFADGRGARPPVEGTVARGQLRADDHMERGLTSGTWAATLPMPVTGPLLHRGRERFEIYCAPCHGLAGFGDGPVARRADTLMEGTWVPPTSLHDATVLGRANGHLYNTIKNGIRNMPAYGPQIPTEDRWAIVAYVRALQRSQHTTLADVPPENRSRLAPGAGAASAPVPAAPPGGLAR